MRTCKNCGGQIRVAGPHWDVLPSCGCKNPQAMEGGTLIITTQGMREQ